MSGALRKSWGWMLAFGIAMVVLGSIGLGMTGALTLASVLSFGFLLLSGILTIVLGIMIMARWPSASLWAIGVFVAIEMIFAGWSQIVIALAARQQKPA